MENIMENENEFAINKKKRGKFIISDEFLELAPQEMRLIMGQCIIVRCEHLFVEHAFLYHAYSDRFDEIEDGMIVPQYGWRFYKNDADEIVKIETQRMD
jgi:hypothetical protein